MKWQKGTAALFICFMGLCIIGSMFLWQGILSAITLEEAKSWPTTPGTLTTCKLESRTNKSGNVTKTAVIEYAYQVDGKPYKNDKLCFDQGGLHSYEAHKAIVEKLQGAEFINVYYDPADPQRSALSAETSGDMFLALVIAVLCLSIALGLALLTWPALRMDSALLKNIKTYS